MPPTVSSELHLRLAHNLRVRAKARHIPISHLADRASVSRAQLWDILLGRRSPTLRFLERVAAVLDCDVADLLARPGKKGG